MWVITNGSKSTKDVVVACRKGIEISELLKQTNQFCQYLWMYTTIQSALQHVLHQFDCDCLEWKAFLYSNEAMLLLQVFSHEMPSTEPRHLCQMNTHQYTSPTISQVITHVDYILAPYKYCVYYYYYYDCFQGHFVQHLYCVEQSGGQLPPKNACLLASDPLWQFL